MFKKDALEHFSVALSDRRRRDKDMAVTNISDVLRITTKAVSKWPEIIPERSAEKLYRLSFKTIPLHPEHYMDQDKWNALMIEQTFTKGVKKWTS